MKKTLKIIGIILIVIAVTAVSYAAYVLMAYHRIGDTPLDKNDPVPSCRSADSACHPGQLVLTIDGFSVSENVDVVSSEVIDTGFACSGHNPVKMTLSLKG